MQVRKKPQYIRDIYYAWNKQDIIKHRKLTDKIKRVISGALNDEWEKDEIIRAIENYAEILKSPDYYWTYRWTLRDFISRGLDKFVDTAYPHQNFKKGGIGDDENTPPLSSPSSPSPEEKQKMMREWGRADAAQKKILEKKWQDEMREKQNG
jgi:hypothetical protein